MSGFGPISDLPVSGLDSFTANQAPVPVIKLVSNASFPQIANYALVAGAAVIFATAVGSASTANSAEYRHGTHAEALYSAEAQKSSIRRSAAQPSAQRVIARISAAPQVDTYAPALLFKAQPAPAVVQTQVPRALHAAEQEYDKTNASFVIQPSAEPPAAVSGILGVYANNSIPQSDPTQLAPLFMPSVVAGSESTANSAEYQYGTHEQALYDAEYRKSIIWQSARTPPVAASGDLAAFIVAGPPSVYPDESGKSRLFTAAVTPPVAATGFLPKLVIGQPNDSTHQLMVGAINAVGGTENSRISPLVRSAEQAYDLGNRSFIIGAARQAVAAPNAVPKMVSAAPEPDVTQQSFISKAASSAQGRVPALVVGMPQADPTQPVIGVLQALQPQPIQIGPVPPLVAAGMPQADPTQIQGVITMPLEFGIAPPPIVDTITGGGRIRHHHLPRQIRGETEDQKRERRIREGTIPAPVSAKPIEIRADSKPEMLREQARIATALKAVRAESDALKVEIAALQNKTSKKALKALVAKEQAAAYAALKEHVLLQEQEAIDVAMIAIAVIFG